MARKPQKGEGGEQRRLFDAARARGAGEPRGERGAPRSETGATQEAGATQETGATPEHLTVTALCALIDAALRRGTPQKVQVVGEVSGFTDRTHWYFRLKDANAAVECVMFAPAARRTGFRPENGMSVLATGKVEFYAKSGRTQVYVERLEPIGAGALEIAFRKLCEEIRALGWFDDSRKRRPAWMPRRIAVITSRTGAAYQDVLDTLRRRAPFIDVLLVDVRVQGERAAPEIAAALDTISRRHEELGIDTVILTRGGGSMEDLWAFNERIVAEAVVRCAVPVVAAIGHEVDTTIAELVADLRAATPTQAALRASPDRDELLVQVARSAHRLHIAARRLLAHEKQRLHASAGRQIFRDPRATLNPARLRLERLASRLARVRPEAVHAQRAASVRGLEARLHQGVRARLRAVDLDALDRALTRAWSVSERGRRASLDALERALRISGPPSVLQRGYSVTQRRDGSVVLAADGVRPGERVRTRVKDGAFWSRVEGGNARPAPARRAARKKKLDDAGQFDLFGEDGG